MYISTKPFLLLRADYKSDYELVSHKEFNYYTFKNPKKESGIDYVRQKIIIRGSFLFTECILDSVYKFDTDTTRKL